MIPLSASTLSCVKRVFCEADVPQAVARLEKDCSDNIHWSSLTSESLERPRFAAIKLSGGSLAELDAAIRLAQTDWRDLLLCAGFANPDAHVKWARRLGVDLTEDPR